MNERMVGAVNEAVSLSMDTTGRILVVDDDAKNRKLLRDILESRGHTVAEASDGATALRLAAETSPDVVLLDIMMPGLDGFEVCKRLKQASDTQTISVILVTALTDRSDRLKGIEVGANDFLVKPIDSRDLVLRVRNAVHMKQLHDRLNESYQRLKELEKLRDDLSRWIVHDMKNPMGAISGHLELLLMTAEDKLDAEQRECVDEALGATRRLIKMADTLLDIGRMEERQMPLKPARCDVAALARDAVAAVRVVANERKLRVRPPDATVEIECDPELVSRVWSNLLDNAIKYAPSEGEITLRVDDGPDATRCEVIDNGPGVPAEYRTKIFEKFGQVGMRRDKKAHSTGLGLAFCKLAVELHGGRIGVISEEGKAGSTFWFELPKSK